MEVMCPIVLVSVKVPRYPFSPEPLGPLQAIGGLGLILSDET